MMEGKVCLRTYNSCLGLFILVFLGNTSSPSLQMFIAWKRPRKMVTEDTRARECAVSQDLRDIS